MQNLIMPLTEGLEDQVLEANRPPVSLETTGELDYLGNNCSLRVDEDTLPEFFNAAECERAIREAESLAAEALSEEWTEQRQPCIPYVTNPCLACGIGSQDDGALPFDFTDTENVPLERFTSKQLNAAIDEQVSKRLKEENIVGETSFVIKRGIVSFAGFCTAGPRDQAPRNLPAPLWTLLPPSPFMNKNGRLDIDCMAFKVDFTDSLRNIVPKFFLAEANQDECSREMLSHGMSHAESISLFCSEDIFDLSKEAEVPA